MTAINALASPHYRRDAVAVLNKTVLYRGFMNLSRYRLKFRQYSGDWSDPLERELLERPPVAGLLAFDPQRDQVVLIEQFRIGALADSHSPWLLELIAGILEDGGESLEALAMREAQEEAGLTIEQMVKICDYWVSPGGTDERVTLFCGRVDAHKARGFHGLKAEHEDIKVHVVDTPTAFAAVESGRINNAATIIALQWLALQQTTLKQQWLK